MSASFYDMDYDHPMSLKTFFDTYKDNLPQMIYITEGYDGDFPWENLSGDQILRVHTYTNQERVLARESTEAHVQRYQYLSIPLDYRMKFHHLNGPKPEDVGLPKTMRELVNENKNLLFQCKFNVRYREDIFVGMDKRRVTSISNLLITKKYTEHYLLCNCLDKGMLFNQPCVLSPSDLITLVIVTGIRGKSHEEFLSHFQSLSEFAADKVTYDRSVGADEISLCYMDTLNLEIEGSGQCQDEKNPLVPFKEFFPDIYATTGPPPRPPPRGGTQSEGIYEPVGLDYEGNESDEYVEIGPKHDSADLQGASGELATGTYLQPTPSGQPPPPLPARDASLRGISKPYQDVFVKKEDHPYKNDNFAAVAPSVHVREKTLPVQNKPVSDMSISEIGDVLKRLKLDKHVKHFKKNMVDGTILSELDDSSLKTDFHFTSVEAIRLMKFVQYGHIPK